MLTRRELILAGAGTLLVRRQVSATPLNSCPNREAIHIHVGGVIGFEALQSESATRLLRKSCRAGLYLHANSWVRTKPEIQKKILNAFSGLNVDVELPLTKDPGDWFKKIYARKFVDAGVQATRAHVNGLRPHRLREWDEFVDAAKQHGLVTISPVFSPNSGQYRDRPFSHESWAYLKEAASLGGGITVDSPSDFFFAQSEGYRQFIFDQIKWAKANSVTSTFIVSPGRAQDKFLDKTKQVFDSLKEADSMPDHFVVENYPKKAPKNYLNVVGDETDTHTILGVALWLATQTY